MSLQDRIRRDATRVFLRQSDFGERITYFPGGDRTKGRTILAIVDRHPTVPMRFDQRTGSADDVVIAVANDADQGVCPATPARDTFEIPVEPGSATVRDLQLFQVEKVDIGMLQLRLR